MKYARLYASYAAWRKKRGTFLYQRKINKKAVGKLYQPTAQALPLFLCKIYCQCIFGSFAFGIFAILAATASQDILSYNAF